MNSVYCNIWSVNSAGYTPGLYELFAYYMCSSSTEMSWMFVHKKCYHFLTNYDYKEPKEEVSRKKNHTGLADDNWNSFPCRRMPWKAEIIVEKNRQVRRCVWYLWQGSNVRRNSVRYRHCRVR